MCYNQPMETYLDIDEAAKILGVHVVTLRRWEREGRLTPLRTPGGHRRYTETQLKGMLSYGFASTLDSNKGEIS